MLFQNVGEEKVEDLLILVDDNDNEIGYGEKMETHITGKLHRAFSLFVFDKKSRSLLIHQRAAGKYHSGGLWTNSCCSHPRKGGALLDAVVRRAHEELGLEIPCGDGMVSGLTEVGKFQYFADFGDISEHEIDHVFIWETDGQVKSLALRFLVVMVWFRDLLKSVSLRTLQTLGIFLSMKLTMSLFGKLMVRFGCIPIPRRSWILCG